ncbi:ScbR family autoregulator-binding transcription factor [Streptomyces sp. NBC_00388]|uniref:ScbR family autoregulator-binding transcription factor n=1 Tax=Streptomyces sp. NBC_00388 TaxID=2975735 RepID=UPI002E1A32B5
MARPKQERAVQTRETILRAAAEVFDEHGFFGASVSRILERAGVTAGAMYFHFESKEGLARAVMNAQPSTIVPLAETDGLQRVVDITMIWSQQLQQNTMLRAGVRLSTDQSDFSAVDASTSYRDWTQILEESLRVASEKGELQVGVDAHELAEFIVEHCSGMQIFASAVSGRYREDLTERTVRMWQVLLPGIAVPAVVARTEVSPQRAQDAAHV